MNRLPQAIRNVCLTAALLPTTIASAQCAGGTCNVGTPPAMVRVVHSLGPCRTYGSGTIIHDDGRRAVVLSCAHLFRGGTGKVQVRLRDGRVVDATPTAIDTVWDLSALEIDSLGIAPVDLATSAPMPGQWLQSCGFGPNGVYQCNRGTARGYTSGSESGTHETLCLTGSARDGDSGGPVLNQRGELVGVLWGTDGRTVHATYCGRIRKFLANLLPNLHAPPRPVEKPPTTEPARPVVPDKPSPDRFDAIASQLQQSAEKQKQRDADLASRMGRLETLVDAIGTIRDRLEPPKLETLPTKSPSPTREAVRSAAASGISSRLAMALPGVLTALGWTTPPSLAAILALRIGLAIIRRRVKKKRSAKFDTQDRSSSLKPLNDQYAEQLNELYALSGRSPTADATLGREYDRELRDMETDADDTTSRWAHNLRRRVADRFLRIHDDSPLPAEPTREARMTKSA